MLRAAFAGYSYINASVVSLLPRQTYCRRGDEGAWSNSTRVREERSEGVWQQLKFGTEAHVSKLLAYVANKNKTTIEMENKNVDEAERLAAEMLGLPPEHFVTEEKKIVTGINCTPENANKVMHTLYLSIRST